MKLLKWQKLALCYLTLGIFIVLGFNNNNDPTLFVERIFKPIEGQNWTFYYSGGILIIAIYIILRVINSLNEVSIINSKGKRIIVVMLLIILLPNVNNYCIKIYKSFYSGLNSIFIDRENTSIQINANDEKTVINGQIDLKNCSNTTQEFYINIKVPNFCKDYIGEEYIIVSEKYKLHPKEDGKIFINEVINKNQSTDIDGYASRAFEYVLFNNEDNIIFKGTYSDYKFDTKYQ